MNAWNRATTANICHPAPAQRSRPALGVPLQTSHPRSPSVSNTVPRLVPAIAPTFTMPRPPTHYRPPRFQYNGMSLPGAMRCPARPPPESVPVPQKSSSPKLHQVGVQHRGVTEPLLSHPTFPSASRPDPPQARIVPLAPPPSPDHPLGVVHRLSRER